MRIDISCVSNRGGCLDMEDTLCLERRGVSDYFGGVFSGHRGFEASRLAAEKMPGVFLKNMKSKLSPAKSLNRTFMEVSKTMKDEMIGTTSLVFFKKKEEIWIANCGDGRALEIRKNAVVQITRDHKTNDKKEKNRILKSGGLIRASHVFHGEYGLMPTRILGNRYFKPVGVIQKPDIFHRRIRNTVGYVFATSSLWNFLENGMIAEILRGTETSRQAMELIIKRYLTFAKAGNLALIVIRPLR